MSRQKKLASSTNIPEHEIEKIARCFYPDIVRDFMNEDIQREFAEWQAEQAARRATLKLHKTNKGGFRFCGSLRPNMLRFGFLGPLGFDSGHIG